MNVLTIQNTNRKFGNDLKQVFTALEHLQGSSEMIDLDFSKCSFINPTLLLPLVALKESSIFSSRIQVDVGRFSASTASYLSTVYFPSCFKADDLSADNLGDFLHRYSSKSYIPIVCFPGGNSDSDTRLRDLVLSSIGNLIKASLDLSAAAQTAIMMLISELSDNIGDHAGAQSGFLVAQHFPVNGYLDICIADCGMGILNSFKRTKPETETSGQAINKAVRGQSTKGVGRGYGISGSIGMLSSIGGEFILLSGDSCSSFVKRINKLGAIVDTPNNLSWPGCLVLIRVPTTMPPSFSVYQFYS